MPKPMPTLIASLRRLPQPGNYYQGVRHAGLPLPDNILLFPRTTEHHRHMTEGRRYSRDFHHRHLLIFSLRGEGRIVVDGKAHVLRPGCCVLVRPYRFHNYTRLSADGFDWLFITFDIAALPPGLDDGVVRRAPPGCDRELQALIACFHGVKRRPAGPRSNQSDMLAWRLALLLALLSEGGVKVRAATRTGANARERLLLQVHALVSAAMGRHLSTHDIASTLGIAESHLRATFRQAAGTSLGRFQRDLRLQHAAALLSRDKATVAEAATACGWESPFAFSRAFRKYWGRPPRRFGTAAV